MLNESKLIPLQVMDFGINETPIIIINGGTFGVTFFKDIYFRVTGK